MTNSKFTTQVIKYSRCVGVELLGWRYPAGRGLEHFVESQKLYPITILPSLKNSLVPIFAARGLMLAKDILDLEPNDFARTTQIPFNQILAVIREANLLFQNNK